MKIVNAEQMREADRKAISDFGVPGEVLMENAGRAVAGVVADLVRVCGYQDPVIELVAGCGNNGGDVFVTGRCLKAGGFDVELLLAGEESAIKGDALIHWNLLKGCGVVPVIRPSEGDWVVSRSSLCVRPRIIVDGIMGTGGRGAARGAALAAIRYINYLAGRHLVVAVDVPSGLNSDTGEVSSDVVVADVTVTMGLPKRGLVASCARDYVGTLEVADIGIPLELMDGVESEGDLITAQDVRGMFCRRARISHKGTYGHLLIIGGSMGYAGAVSLAALAAVRSGAGLVSVFTPVGVFPVVSGIVPEAMVHGALETADGSLARDALSRWGRDINEFDAVLVGPGMGNNADTRGIVEQILGASNVPLVLDADALNVLAGELDIVSNASCSVVMTPHPGEMARLTGINVSDIQSDRVGHAVSTAERTGAVVVLKGSGTVVAARRWVPNINMTGNPGMATGGMGDVLGGLVAGLMAQGLSPFDAARAGVYLHGVAGDFAAWRGSEAGMTAGDVIKELPVVLRRVMPR